MPSSSSEEARKGLAASVLGKAKEVVGAVTGNDSLATQGQLQQAEAAARKEASATEAVAKVRAEEAAQALQRERVIAEVQTDALESAAAAREAQVRQQAAAEKAQVDIEAERQLLRDQADAAARAERERAEAAAQARQDQSRVAQDQREAQAEHADKRESAEAAESAAARARAEADRLAAQADLPS